MLATNTQPVCTVVCSQHGDERFGLSVFERLLQDAQRRSRVNLVLANEEAIEQNVRYIESDLNRSYPGNRSGSLEERMAYQLLPVVQQTPFVIDIHTTTAAIRMTPIVARLTDAVRTMVGHTDSTEVALIAPVLAQHSLIGNVDAGVSLEFNESYARTESAYDAVLRVMDGLIEQRITAPTLRNIYTITGGIDITTPIPEDARDFALIPEIGVYPFLLHERAYAQQYHALAATHVESMML